MRLSDSVISLYGLKFYVLGSTSDTPVSLSFAINNEKLYLIFKHDTHMSLLGWIETCNVKISHKLLVKRIVKTRDIPNYFSREIVRFSDIILSKSTDLSLTEWTRHECFSLLLQRRSE